MIGDGVQLSDTFDFEVEHPDGETKAAPNLCARRDGVFDYKHVVAIFREGLLARNIPLAASVFST